MHLLQFQCHQSNDNGMEKVEDLSGFNSLLFIDRKSYSKFYQKKEVFKKKLRMH